MYLSLWASNVGVFEIVVLSLVTYSFIVGFLDLPPSVVSHLYTFVAYYVQIHHRHRSACFQCACL